MKKEYALDKNKIEPCYINDKIPKLNQLFQK